MFVDAGELFFLKVDLREVLEKNVENKLELFQEWFIEVAEKYFEIRNSECLDRIELLKTLTSLSN